MKNIIQEIDCLSNNNVHIKNPERLNEKLRNMCLGGIGRLQVVSDFDRTITKQHENGVPHLSSFAIFSKCPSSSCNEDYMTTVQYLRSKYYPIEMDPTMPLEEKIAHMEVWWAQSEAAIKGLKVSPEEISEVCTKLKPSLREGTREFFKDLSDENVPLLVFSAGCGDVVKTILKQGGVLLPNVKVISNFLKYNSEGVIQGFRDKAIHVFNKNEFAIKDTKFYHTLSDRDNIIVLGDSVGDAEMTKGMDHVTNILKIGFLYERIEEALPLYLDTFDIVLVDDQTMEVPKGVFDYIKNTEVKK